MQNNNVPLSHLHFVNQVSLWLELGFEEERKRKGRKAIWSIFAILPRLARGGSEGAGQAEQEAASGPSRGERARHLGRTRFTQPGTLGSMSPGPLSASNNNSIRSQLKPSHKSYLMLPRWVESNIPGLLITCQAPESQRPPSEDAGVWTCASHLCHH